MAFKEYKNLDYAVLAEEILSFWKNNDIFEKSISSREGKQSYTFYEGHLRPTVPQASIT